MIISCNRMPQDVTATVCIQLDFASSMMQPSIYMEKAFPKTRLISSGIIAILTTMASPALAVQTHGGAEGLVSHQIGHVFFAIGMGYLLYHLYRNHVAGPGWLEFKWFLWLIILWNFITFSGHLMDELIDPHKFILSGEETVSFSIAGWTDCLFYLTRLDHLVLVPSFIMLLLAIRKWERQSC